MCWPNEKIINFLLLNWTYLFTELVLFLKFSKMISFSVDMQKLLKAEMPVLWHTLHDMSQPTKAMFWPQLFSIFLWACIRHAFFGTRFANPSVPANCSQQWWTSPTAAKSNTAIQMHCHCREPHSGVTIEPNKPQEALLATFGGSVQNNYCSWANMANHVSHEYGNSWRPHAWSRPAVAPIANDGIHVKQLHLQPYMHI